MIPILAHKALQHRLAVLFIRLPAEAVFVAEVAGVGVFRVCGRVLVVGLKGASGELAGSAVAAEVPFGVEFEELVVAVALCVESATT